MQSTTMNTERINELLDRYYEALTTEAEEKELKLFFSQGEVPIHLMREKEIFMQLQEVGAGVTIPEDLEERLSVAIDSWEAQEEVAKKNRRIYTLRWVGSIAASLLVIIAFSWYQHEANPMQRDTFATPEEAYVEAHNALMQFAMALDKGAQQLAIVHSTTAKIEENISEYLTLTIE